ncbi:unnamed protein product [Meganyctiphanes norvegica]|uniref:Carboxylic ester hydrolase n=1 Tax=Meganyctiphanes norvegica TaxID=48144 RepID=A0AAV2R559_MEGNR
MAGSVPVVQTSLGLVRGCLEESSSGKPFYSYTLPYAKPPTGYLRFRAPECHSGWSGIYDGSEVPPPAIQPDMMELLVNKKVKTVGQEDCLYLTVSTNKANNPRAHLPVLVWLHGGGYYMGSTADYPPHVIMNKDFIFVGVQYRLSVLGFLSTEDSVVPGNMGLLDQRLALLWVRDNIVNFGGDPNNITIMGESAGAASVHAHILSPLSKGLFHRSIMQSGNALCPWALGGHHLQLAQELGRNHGWEMHMGTEALLSTLQRAPAEDLLKAMVKHMGAGYLLLGPRVDGTFLPAPPEVLLQQGRYNHVDILTGVTKDEGSMITYRLYGTRTGLKHHVAKLPVNAPLILEFRDEEPRRQEMAVQVYKHYLGGDGVPGSGHADQMTQMLGDRYFAVPHDLSSKLHLQNRKTENIFLYEFKHRGKLSSGDLFRTDIGKDWVTHADDLLYLFSGGPLFIRDLEDEQDLRMRDIILNSWYNFAKSGNPTPDNSLGFSWVPSNEDSLSHLSLMPQPYMEEDLRIKTRMFWSSLPTLQNQLLRNHPPQNKL